MGGGESKVIEKEREKSRKGSKDMKLKRKLYNSDGNNKKMRNETDHIWLRSLIVTKCGKIVAKINETRLINQLIHLCKNQLG